MLDCLHRSSSTAGQVRAVFLVNLAVTSEAVRRKWRRKTLTTTRAITTTGVGTVRQTVGTNGSRASRMSAMSQFSMVGPHQCQEAVGQQSPDWEQPPSIGFSAGRAARKRQVSTVMFRITAFVPRSDSRNESVASITIIHKAGENEKEKLSFDFHCFWAIMYVVWQATGAGNHEQAKKRPRCDSRLEGRA